MLSSMKFLSHPSQEGFEGLSDLLPLCIASLCNNVNDCVFICSCSHEMIKVMYVVFAFDCGSMCMLICFSNWGHIPNPFIAFLSACASEAGSKSAAGRTVGLNCGSGMTHFID